DPRVVTSFLAWAVYAFYMGMSSLGGGRGRRVTYFLIGGFPVLLVAYLVDLRWGGGGGLGLGEAGGAGTGPLPVAAFRLRLPATPLAPCPAYQLGPTPGLSGP